MRRLALVSIGIAASGLVLAQPPVPLYAEPTAAPELAAAPDPSATNESQEESDRVTRISVELETLRTRHREASQKLRDRVRALYRLRHGGAMPTAGGVDALLARAGRLERLERVIVDDLRRVDDYARRESAASAELERARVEASEGERRRRDAEAARLAMEAQMATAEYGVGPLPALGIAPMPTAVIDTIDPVAPPSSGFALLRGRLGLPVLASIGMRDAVRDDGPGLEFLVRPGTAVVAVADGRVAFAGDYGSYGRMVILDHGDTFYTIYAGLGRMAARVGDWMSRGGTIAEVASGASPALFFEVRRGTRSLDTRNWLGVAR